MSIIRRRICKEKKSTETSVIRTGKKTTVRGHDHTGTITYDKWWKKLVIVINYSFWNWWWLFWIREIKLQKMCLCSSTMVSRVQNPSFLLACNGVLPVGKFVLTICSFVIWETWQQSLVPTGWWDVWAVQLDDSGKTPKLRGRAPVWLKMFYVTADQCVYLQTYPKTGVFPFTAVLPESRQPYVSNHRFTVWRGNCYVTLRRCEIRLSNKLT